MVRLAVHMKVSHPCGMGWEPARGKDSASQTAGGCLGDMGSEGIARSAIRSYMGKRENQEIGVQGQV